MDILNELMSKYSDDVKQKIAEKAGVGSEKSKEVVDTVTKMLTAKIAENASTPEGLKSLTEALKKHENGGMLEKIKDLLDDNIDTDTEGKKILSHVFKDDNEQEGFLSKIKDKFNLDSGTIMKLLPMIAPVVMGMLGKTKKEKNADESGVSSILGGVMDSFKKDKSFLSMIPDEFSSKIKDGLLEKAKSSIMNKIFK